MPVLSEMTPYKSFIQQHTAGRRYIAHCYDEVPRVNLFDELRTAKVDEETLVMIGPEGDFSIDEVRMAVDAGFISVDLGKKPSAYRNCGAFGCDDDAACKTMLML